MKRASGTIVWLFGADGVGKTTLAEQLAAHPDFKGSILFNGVKPGTWPDGGAYARDLVDAGIDDRTNRDPEHYMDKIRRCYDLAGRLATEAAGPVIIDSCPRGKTIIGAIIDPDRDRVCGRRESVSQYEATAAIIGGTAAAGVTQIGLHVTFPRWHGGYTDKGAILLDRLKERDGGLSEFDPTTAEDAGSRMGAAQDLSTLLSLREQPQVRAETLYPISIDSVVSDIRQLMES